MVGLNGNPVLGGHRRKGKMRNLLFKNLTSNDRRKRVVSSSEITEKEGVRSVIRRHFIYIVKEVSNPDIEKPKPSLCVLKEQDTKEQRQKFFCKLKGSVLAVNRGRLFLIAFMHTLKITLVSSPQEVV